MNYPSILISNKSKNLKVSDTFQLLEYNEISIAYESNLISKILIINTPEYLLFAHTNIEFRNRLLNFNGQLDVLLNCLIEILSDLHWGFVLTADKTNNQVTIYNDVYGIYPLYYSFTDNKPIISNDCDYLIKIQEKPNFDVEGIYDFFLFNYTLNNRTVFQNISQMVGGSRIISADSLMQFKIEKIFDATSLFHDEKEKKINFTKTSKELENCLLNNLDKSLPNQLPLSGGFDSKVLFSILLSAKKDFRVYTYGSANSVDNTAATLTAKQFNIPHTLLELNELDKVLLDEKIKHFVCYTPGLPLLLDLIAYEEVKQKIPASNIILGAMGGEFINGPVVISEVLVTRSAKTLTTSISVKELKVGLINDLSTISFLNLDNYRKFENKYLKSITNYLLIDKDKYAKNLTSFMLNETFAKFFGVVFKNLFGKNNLINPFVDLKFLKTLLNSNNRYSKHKLFSKNPFVHILSRRLYAKLVRIIYKPVLYTPLDRNYCMADLLYLYRFPVTIKRYIENHFFNKNKGESSKTLNYTQWYKTLLINKLYNSPVLDLDFIYKNEVRKILDKLKKNEMVSDYIIRKLIILLSIHYLIEIYNIEINK